MKKVTMFMAFLVGCTGGTGAGSADAGDAGGGDVSLDGGQDGGPTGGAAYQCQANSCTNGVTCGCVMLPYTPPADTTCTTATVEPCDDGNPMTTDLCGFSGCAHVPTQP